MFKMVEKGKKREITIPMRIGYACKSKRAEERYIGAVKKLGSGCTIKEIADHLDYNPKTVRWYLPHLFKTGKLIGVQSKKGTPWRVYLPSVK